MCSQFSANPTEFDFEADLYELGASREERKARRKKRRQKFRKVAKGVTLAPLKVVHKITHGKNSPIRKAELALQKVVGKALPFTKPLIEAHNKISTGIYKGMEKIGVAKKGETLLATRTKKLGTPQGAATRLAAELNVGGQWLAPGERKALEHPQFLEQTLAHLMGAAQGGNQTAIRALQALTR